MTEEEAKTKACCGPEGCGHQAGHWALEATPVGMPIPAQTSRWFPDGRRVCIGSACTAWRWGDSTPAEHATLELFGIAREQWVAGCAMQLSVADDLLKVVARVEAEGWRALGPSMLFGMSWNIGRGEVKHGYCGLAGKP